jgi:hypothetical protein
MKLLPLAAAAVLALSARSQAIMCTFDVDGLTWGVGSFTINVPDTWGDVHWLDLYGDQYFSAVSFSGNYISYSGRDGSATYIPWQSVEIAFFNNHYGYPGVPPPDIASAKLWVIAAPDNLSTNHFNGATFGATPLEAIESMGGVTLRQPQGLADVPDTGSTLALFSVAIAGIAVLKKSGGKTGNTSSRKKPALTGGLFLLAPYDSRFFASQISLLPFDTPV